VVFRSQSSSSAGNHNKITLMPQQSLNRTEFGKNWAVDHLTISQQNSLVTA
jgi:hypothetical protein